jgi:propionyl-CoA carboxylase alpha chain
MALSTATGGAGGPVVVQLARDGVHWVLTTRGAQHRALVLRAPVAPLARHMIRRDPPDLSKLLISPMPGLLTAVHVAEGDTVFPGQPLATIEAMKMENILRATRQAVVQTIKTSVGASVAADEIILTLE